MKLVVFRGLPGSGKTTLAQQWVAEDRERRARVNRDDLRAMLHQGYVSGDVERAVAKARDALIRALLRRGFDVASDDTNLPSRVVRDLRRIAVTEGAEFEVRDLTDVEVDVCIERDAARDRTVGEQVIRDMYMRFVKGKPFPLPIADEPEDAKVRPYVPDLSLPPAVIVDVDGTVALMSGRSPYDESRVHEDRPNVPVVDTVKALRDSGMEIVFMSARTEGCWDATFDWLYEHVGPEFRGPFMRKIGDMRKDSVVKAELFDEEVRDYFNVRLVLDDRDQVVSLWRSLGLPCFQVADGDF